MTGDDLPRGWRLTKLGDLGEVNRGRSRHRPRYAEHLYGGPYPFIQTGDIKSSGGRITKYQQTYNEAGLAQSRMWPAGTMCITIAANIAETGILTFPACFPDSVVGFIADNSKCDVYFVEYAFRYLKQQIQHEASGSVQDNINLATLERLRFPLPPLPEQRAIAHILGTLDDKIELNRRMNDTLEAMARAIFKSWFVDFDPGLPKPIADLFPDRFEDSDLGEIPAGWSVCGLDVIARFLNGLALQKYPPAGDESLPAIKIEQLRTGDTRGADRASASLNPEYIVEDGDVLFSWSGSLECVLRAGAANMTSSMASPATCATPCPTPRSSASPARPSN
jgi:type I restriction enzyme S subunit